jgi:hypothetical protein
VLNTEIRRQKRDKPPAKKAKKAKKAEKVEKPPGFPTLTEWKHEFRAEKELQPSRKNEIEVTFNESKLIFNTSDTASYFSGGNWYSSTSTS